MNGFMLAVAAYAAGFSYEWFEAEQKLRLGDQLDATLTCQHTVLLEDRAGGRVTVETGEELLEHFKAAAMFEGSSSLEFFRLP